MWGDSAPCVGRPVIYAIAPVTGANSYVWNYPAGWTLVSGSTTDTLNLTSGNGGGTVTVQAVNGCGQGIPSVLNVNAIAAPNVTAISGYTLTCPSQAVQYIAQTSGATSYTWTYPGGWSVISGTSSDTLHLTAGNAGGNITVQATNTCGQSSPTSLSVQVGTGPSAGAITGTDSVCINASGNISFSLPNATGADSIYWALPNGWSIVSGQNTNSITINNNQTGGAINASVYNVCGSNNAAPFNLDVVDTPTASINQSHDTLSTAAIGTYQWYLNGSAITGATAQNYVTTVNGSYTVAVTNSASCTGVSGAYNYVYLSISNIAGDNTVAIFPNPSANGIFQLSLSNLPTGAHLKVFDALGRVVFEKDVNEMITTINLSHLSKGIYLASIELNGTLVKRSLVVE